MISLIKKKGVNPITKETIWFPQWTRIRTIVTAKLAKIMSRGGTYSIGEATGMLLDFPQYIFDELMEGNAVFIEGLGTFKLKVTGKSKKKKEEVNSVGTKISVVYEPDIQLESRINAEKEFEFVEKPTKEGEKDAEEDTPSVIDSSTGDETPADTSTNTTVDTSTGTTVDTSTGSNNNGGDDIPAGNG